MIAKQRHHLNSATFRPDRKVTVGCGLTYLAINDNTNDCERMFSRLNLLEAKQRQRKLGLFNLKDCLKCSWSMSRELALYLQPTTPKVRKINELTDTMEPNDLLEASCHRYYELFGEAREFVAKVARTRSATETARQSLRNKVPTNATRMKGPSAKQSEKGRRNLWQQAATDMVRQSRKAKKDREDGRHVPPLRSIFGHEITKPGSVQVERKGLSATEKLVKRRIKVFARDAKKEFHKEESSLGISGSAKPFTLRSSKVLLTPKGNPKRKSLKQVSEAIARCRVVQKQASVKRQATDMKNLQAKKERWHMEECGPPKKKVMYATLSKALGTTAAAIACRPDSAAPSASAASVPSGHYYLGSLLLGRTS